MGMAGSTVPLESLNCSVASTLYAYNNSGVPTCVCWVPYYGDQCELMIAWYPPLYHLMAYLHITFCVFLLTWNALLLIEQYQAKRFQFSLSHVCMVMVYIALVARVIQRFLPTRMTNKDYNPVFIVEFLTSLLFNFPQLLWLFASLLLVSQWVTTIVHRKLPEVSDKYPIIALIIGILFIIAEAVGLVLSYVVFQTVTLELWVVILSLIPVGLSILVFISMTGIIYSVKATDNEDKVLWARSYSTILAVAWTFFLFGWLAYAAIVFFSIPSNTAALVVLTISYLNAIVESVIAYSLISLMDYDGGIVYHVKVACSPSKRKIRAALDGDRGLSPSDFKFISDGSLADLSLRYCHDSNDHPSRDASSQIHPNRRHIDFSGNRRRREKDRKREQSRDRSGNSQVQKKEPSRVSEDLEFQPPPSLQHDSSSHPARTQPKPIGVEPDPAFFTPSFNELTMFGDPLISVQFNVPESRSDTSYKAHSTAAPAHSSEDRANVDPSQSSDHHSSSTDT